MSDDDWKNLKTLDKILHKNWKSRKEGYAEAISEINSCDYHNDKKIDKYLGIITKLPTDPNAVALEKAIELVLLFVQRFNISDVIAGEICEKIILNCLGNTRLKTKENGFNTLKMLMELEKHDTVIKELLKAVVCKQPNIIFASVILLKEALREFGPKIVPVKDLFKVLPKLLQDRDKNIREAGKELIIEIYRWIGKQAITPQLAAFKTVQVAELNAEFDKLPNENAIPTRYIRSQKPITSLPVESAMQCNSTAEGLSKNIECDRLEYTDPVSVLSKMPPDFYDKIEAKKWTDRKEALEVIEKITNHEHLEGGDYGELVKTLVKIISKDVNINLVTQSSKILIQLAKGLRKKFSPYAITTMQACLDKFKERKGTVVSSLKKCVFSIYETTTLESIIPTIVDSLSNKNPSVKLETILFMNKILLNSSKEMFTKKILKQLIPAVVRLSLDNNVDVREGSFLFLGTAMKVLSDNVIMAFLGGIDNVRMARINDFFTKEYTEKDTPQKVVFNMTENKENLISNVPVNIESLPSVIEKESIKVSKYPIPNEIFEEMEVNDPFAQTRILQHSLNDCYSPIVAIPSHQDHCEIERDRVDVVINEDIVSHSNNQMLCEDSNTFKKILKSMVFDENMHIKSYISRITTMPVIEKIIYQREAISCDRIKSLIANISCTDINISYCALCALFNQNILENPSFLKEYGPLLAIVVLRQMLTIIDTFSKVDVENLEVYGDSIHDLLFILNYVMDGDRDPLFNNERITEATLAVLDRVVHCVKISTLGDYGHFIAVIKSLVSDIYRRTRHLSIANTVEYFTIHICAPELTPTCLFQDVDLPHYLECIYDEYVQIPAQSVIELGPLVDPLTLHDHEPVSDITDRINSLREYLDLEKMDI